MARVISSNNATVSRDSSGRTVITLGGSAPRQAVTRSPTASGGGSSTARASETRIRELQSQGLDRADAAQIAGAEARGQTLTGVRADVARVVQSRGISSSALRPQEIQRATQTQATPQRGTGFQMILSPEQSRFAQTLSAQERANYFRQLQERNLLNEQQREFARTLSREDREEFLRQVASRRTQPVQAQDLTRDEIEAIRAGQRRGTPLAVQTDKRDISKAEKEAKIAEQQAVRPRALATTSTIAREVPKQQQNVIVRSAKRLGEIVRRIPEVRGELRFQRTRERAQGATQRQISKTTTLLLGATIVDSIFQFTRGLVMLPKTAFDIIRNPSILKKVPSLIKEDFNQFTILLRTNPDEALVRLGTELVLLKGTARLISELQKLAGTTLTKLSPKYVGTARTGQKLQIKTKTGRTVKLDVVARIPTKKLTEQVALAGRKVDAISSQADSLLGVLRRQRTIKKPIPANQKLTREIQTLIKKLDAQKITPRELSRLNTLIKQKGAKGILERAFFADPSGKIRPSRLGISTKDASLLDAFTGNITFRRGSPQILLFEKAVVQRFPIALKDIQKALRKGKTLTREQSDRLLAFQLQKTGKFKPIGFLTGESEIVLATAEILVRKGVVGRTIVKGRGVPIVQVEVKRATGELRSLLNKFRSGNLPPVQVRKLDRLLKSKTKLDYGLSKYVSRGKYVDPRRIVGNILVSATRSFKSNIRKQNALVSRDTSPRRSPAKSPRKTTRSAKSPAKSVKKTAKSPAKSPRKTTRSAKSPAKSVKKTTKSPRKSPRKTTRSPARAVKGISKLPKQKLSFDKEPPRGFNYMVNAIVRVRGRNREIPLRTTKNRALKKLQELVDNTTARSFQLRIVGLTRKKDIRKPSEKKFRKKISKGTPVLRVVEKSKYAIDTKGEKKGLTMARLLRRKKIPTRKPKKK